MKLLLRLLLLPMAAVLLLPVFLLIALGIAACDAFWFLFGRRANNRTPAPGKTGESRSWASPVSVSVIIPTWNARDLLEKFLPSVVRAAAFNAQNEVIVVDNASTDGTAEFVQASFPSVRLLRLEKNLGFGGGNNAGVRAAQNNVVIVLNNDMRVEPECFERLLEGFTDPDVFAVSAQIFFLDRGKRREETGLTEGRFTNGFFQFGHLAEDVTSLYPTFYAGGGSTAYDRGKYLQLGGFDALFHPFYVEDADLSYNAWKRGWKVVYHPDAIVHHEHRGTIGKRFSAATIENILKKNHVLMVWKNVHSWAWLMEHLFFAYAGALLSLVFPPSPTRTTLAGLLRAVKSWPQAMARRWAARTSSVVNDAEACRRPLPAFYRDRFLLPDRQPTSGRPLNILFAAPYSIYPPTHGGGVFMFQTVRELARRNRVHVLAFVEQPEELETNRELEKYAASVQCMVRGAEPPADFLGAVPYSVRCFAIHDFERLLHRTIWEEQIDVVQLEYTQLGQFAGPWLHIPSVLFEHDVYFQTTRRSLARTKSAAAFTRTCFEWLRAVRYELRLLRRVDLVQTCSEKERLLLESFVGKKGPAIRGDLRAAIDVRDYEPVFGGREPETLLFVGSFRHPPNIDGVRFLVREVMPGLRRARPGVRLMVVGSEPSAEVEALCREPGVCLLGSVPDIREVLARYSVFLAPIFTGSGVRVKLLEAFAAGMPVVATPLGAEGLDVKDGRDLLLARDAREFTSVIIDLLENRARAETMARSARVTVEERYSAEVVVGRLERSYRELVAGKASLGSGDSFAATMQGRA